MYLLFAGDVYYPGGGWDDYVGAFASIDLARQAAADSECEWYQIVDPSIPYLVESGDVSDIRT